MSSLSVLALHLNGYSQLLLAYSGGLDSTVLLHQLVQLREQQPELKLRALHVHHGLSPNADAWAAHCQAQCQRWQIPCEVVRVSLDSADPLGTEGAARQARYAALASCQQPGELLLTAQHLDDQSETLLLALKRGSGPAGLAAMPAWREIAGRPHCRPLLHTPRQALEAWAQQYRLTWIEDESNADTRYDRNFLRQQILPPLLARWPHFSQAVARSAALCGEQEALLDELLAPTLATYLHSDGSFAIATLHSMSVLQRNALLRRWIARCGVEMPSRDLLERLWQEVVLSREDASPRLRWGRQVICRYRQRLYLLPARLTVLPQSINWSAPGEALPLPGGLGMLQTVAEGGCELRAPRAEEQVSIRFQAQGEFYIVGRAGRRALKKIWQEHGIPPWLRNRTPLMFYNDMLIAALGVFVTREGEVTAEAEIWRVRWLSGTDSQ